MHADLTIRARDRSTRSMVLKPGQCFVLGRSRNATVKIEDPKISRRHATLELRQDGVFLTDLESRNGTYLGPVRIKAQNPVRVRTGEVVRIGSHELRIEVHGAEEDAQARTAHLKHADAALFPPEEVELLEELGAGATGRVWAAHQKLLGRKVAVKVFRQEHEDPRNTGRERFLREGRLAMKVRSPYVVEVYDVRVVEGVPVIIMELINGPSVMDRIKAGELEISRALKIAEDVGRALLVAGDAGVVHRDVKPHNILLGPDGLAKLGDFGLAKDVQSSNLTLKGIGLGSLPYAAPEQIEDASAVDARTDTYGLGSTLYHMIAGQPLFEYEGVRLVQLVRRITREEPKRLDSVRSECPPSVADLVHAMVAKEPAGRPTPLKDVVARLCELRLKHYPRSDEPRDDKGDLYETSEDVTHI